MRSESETLSYAMPHANTSHKSFRSMQNNFNKLDSYRSILCVFIDPFVSFAATKFKYCSSYVHVKLMLWVLFAQGIFLHFSEIQLSQLGMKLHRFRISLFRLTFPFSASWLVRNEIAVEDLCPRCNSHWIKFLFLSWPISINSTATYNWKVFTFQIQ